MTLPPLLEERPPALQIVLGAVVPAVFGAIVGLLLITSEPAYLIGSVLGIAGGFFAGLEHDNKADGAARGFIGGFLFGLFILAVRDLSGEAGEAHLPDPPALLLVITVGFGIGLGALGARAREKRTPAVPAPDEPAAS